MRNLKSISIIVITTLLLASTATVSASRISIASLEDKIEDTGVIRLLNREGMSEDIFVIDVQDPVSFVRQTKGYYPLNLEEFGEEFHQDGLNVQFSGYLSIPSILSFTNFRLFLSGYLPIRLSSIQKIVQEPKLSLGVTIGQEYEENEPITVFANLKNIGDKGLNVLDMGFEIGTLDFIIQTPDGTISYIGERWRMLPQVKYLEPGQELSCGVEDITQDGLFGSNEISYRFSPGAYSLKAVYTSSESGGAVNPENLWTGVLNSDTYRFEIIEDNPGPEMAELVLDVDPHNELTADIFTLDPSPVSMPSPFDGKLHAMYYLGTEVSVKVDEKVGDFNFVSWSGDITGTFAEVSVLMDKDKSAIAHFIEDIPDVNEPPVARFTYNPKMPIMAEQIHFVDLSEDDSGVVEWHWDFGDEETSDLQNPSHAYEASGQYTVCLTVYDSEGLSDTFCLDIDVKSGQTPQESGEIVGIVMEEGGLFTSDYKPIAGATVMAVRVSSGSCAEQIANKTETDEKGCFRLGDLEPGNYVIVASCPGFEPESQKAEVRSGQTIDVLFVLKQKV